MTQYIVFTQSRVKTAKYKQYKKSVFVGIMNVNELIAFKGSVSKNVFVSYAKFI